MILQNEKKSGKTLHELLFIPILFEKCVRAPSHVFVSSTIDVRESSGVKTRLNKR